MVVKVCEECGHEFNANHGNTKYCKKCKPLVKQKQNNERQRRYYWKWKHLIKAERKKYIGGRTISAHAKKDFDEEMRIVQNHRNKILGRRE